MAENKKYYWFRLKKDFFEGHKIKMIEAMDNGSEYLVFYLKLLCESVSHEGRLRFSETIPYSEKMLSAITHTNIDVVRMAMAVFKELELVTIEDDNTIYMREVATLMGSETEYALKKRDYRMRLNEGKSDKIETSRGQCPIEYRDKSIEYRDNTIVKESNREKSKRFSPPTLEEVTEYCVSRNNGIDAQHFIDYYSMSGWKLTSGNKMKDWKSAIRNWEKNDKKYSKEKPQQAVKGVYYDEEDLSIYNR